MRLYSYFIILLFFIISGCGAYYNQPTGIEKAVIGEYTSNNIIKGFA
jgi:curli production assembly/transport component CsgG